VAPAPRGGRGDGGCHIQRAHHGPAREKLVTVLARHPHACSPAPSRRVAAAPVLRKGAGHGALLPQFGHCQLQNVATYVVSCRRPPDGSHRFRRHHSHRCLSAITTCASAARVACVLPDLRGIEPSDSWSMTPDRCRWDPGRQPGSLRVQVCTACVKSAPRGLSRTGV